MTDPPEGLGDWLHFDDPWSFDEHWRRWIDNPPLAWRPPENKRVLSHVFDNMQKAGWVVRIDAWLGAEGLHLHFRWVAMVIGPKREDYDRWLEQGQQAEKKPGPDWYVTKNGVMGWVLNWHGMALLEELLTQPEEDKPNGKGGDLSDADRKDL